MNELANNPNLLGNLIAFFGAGFGLCLIAGGHNLFLYVDKRLRFAARMTKIRRMAPVSRPLTPIDLPRYGEETPMG